MISTTEIGTIIADPGSVSPELSNDLKGLSDKYPYSQVFSILLLRSLKTGNDVRFEEELLKNSFRITDRNRLYDLVHDQSSAEQKVIEQEAEDIIEISTVDETPFEKEPTVEEQIIPEPEVEIKENVLSEEIPQEEEAVDEIIPETNEKMDPLEESILHNSLALNYHLDELTEEEEQALEERTKIQEEKEEEPDEIFEPEEEARIDSEQTFTSWLHSDSNYEEKDNSDKKAINAVVDSFSDFNPMEDLFGEVEKPKAEFFSPAKKAKESLDEQTLPVSETLAKIYALQGNYPKAIEAYEQLSLKYPEKKIFFANLIKDLKKLINK